MPVPKVTDQRLCWLAVRDRLSMGITRNAALLLGGLLVAGTLVGYLTLGALGMTFAALLVAGLSIPLLRPSSQFTRQRMEHYSVAVAEASTRLSDDERATLRRTGLVPDWFLGEVRRRRDRSRRG